MNKKESIILNSPFSDIVNIGLLIAETLFPKSEIIQVVKACSPIITKLLSNVGTEDELESSSKQEPDSTSQNNETNLALSDTIEQEIIPVAYDDNGSITGGASRINRKKESVNIEILPKNNDIFFEKERQNPQSILMRYNADKNKNRPDAKLFMDIALVGPKNVPSTQDYQFISSKNNKIINKKYNLKGNKEIPWHYDGFIFSANSSTAHALNNSSEFKNQILNSKNYDSSTGNFTRDKLEIEFKYDKNLQYSFGHMTVINPKIEDGYITGIGYDKYDYSILYNYNKNDYEGIFFNNCAKVLQLSDKLHNYFVIVPIKIKL